MKKIIDYRGSGKTTELIKMSHDENKYIVCATEQNKRNICEMAFKMGLTIPNPISAHEICECAGLNYGVFKRKGVLVDDADRVLRVLIGCQVDALTMSNA